MSKLVVAILWLVGLMCLGYVIDISVDLYRGELNTWALGSFLMTLVIWTAIFELHKRELKDERLERWEQGDD